MLCSPLCGYAAFRWYLPTPVEDRPSDTLLYFIILVALAPQPERLDGVVSH